MTDAEAVAMSRHLALHDGLFLGSSSAVNLVACVRLARRWGRRAKGKRIVTILCDSGARHVSRFWYVVDDLFSKVPPPPPFVESSARVSCDCRVSHVFAYRYVPANRRNDDYLERAGIPVSSSIEFLFTEPVLAGSGDSDDDDAAEAEAGPASASETELASDDPLELPPLSPKLAFVGETQDGHVFGPR